MKILIALEDIRIGGAQTFALRLAQALRMHDHEVHLYSHYAHLANHELVRKLAPDVPVISYGDGAAGKDWLLRKADGVRRRLGLYESWRERRVIRHLRSVIRRLRPDIVNSHTIKSDFVAARALEGSAIPLVTTMHGCYELFLHKADAPEVIGHGRYALAHAQALVYLTDKNLEIFDQPEVRALASITHRKIYNGFDGQLTQPRHHARAALGIPDDATVFGMVARGIPEKGWHHAVESFLELADANPAMHLVLVGESAFLTELQTRRAHPRLHFTGFASNPIDWVDAFDVGLLPSFFHAESLPNSIAEYLSCGKPAIPASHLRIAPRISCAGHSHCDYPKLAGRRPVYSAGLGRDFLRASSSNADCHA